MESIYEEIARRTEGSIYLAVAGPVRTGKSTFVKRFMEQMVIPAIDNVYHRERARDELPQSGSGKTITTAEPKFIPENGVEICPDGETRLRVRLIDSVGYMVPGAIGAEEDGVSRMVTTPWFDHEIPMTQAAELGTKKVMEEHCTVGLIVTTDGSITEIPREDYQDAEDRSIRDMQATGKPFLVVLNSTHPKAEETRELAEAIAERHGVSVLPVSCMDMCESEILEILGKLLYEFPVRELRFFLPGWVVALPGEHPIKDKLFHALRTMASKAERLSEIQSVFAEPPEDTALSDLTVRDLDPGSGVVSIMLLFPQQLFYQVLSEQCGMEITGDRALMNTLRELAAAKTRFDRVAGAMEQVRATGYGVVMPTTEEISLEEPEILRKNGSYGVRLKASAPSIHMLRADIETVLSPMVGDEKQSEDLVRYLLSEYEEDTGKLWESNIFGKSLFELVSEGLSSKLQKMPEEARMKLRETVQRIINEDSSGLICLIF